MLTDINGLVLSLLILTFGAEGLVRGSSSLAVRAGISPLIAGLTIVAFGTSTPELVVSLNASLNHQADIALGNVVGSNIFNIGIILGLTALICPVKVSSQVVRNDGPIMIGASVLLLFMLYYGPLSRASGTALFAGLIVYMAYIIRLARKEVSGEENKQLSEALPSHSRFIFVDIVFIVGGLLFLVAGSRLLVTSAVDIARHIGVSEAVIGLTIVAAGTSMPELATSVIAALRRQPDIAVGNVIGSNIFNILGILGLSSIATPLSASGISSIDLWVMVVFAIALIPLLYTELRLQRWEGVLLLSGYSIYLWYLWPDS